MSLRTLNEALDYAEQFAVPHRRAPRVQSVRDPLPLAISGMPYASGTFDMGKAHKTQEMYEHLRGRVYSSFGVVARRIAGQPLMIARVIEDGKSARSSLKSALDSGYVLRSHLPEDIKRIDPNRLDLLDDHPLIQAVENPNPFMVRHTLWTNTVLNLLTTGWSYWLLNPSKGGKLSITPLPTHWVTPLHDRELFGEFYIKPQHASEGIQVPRENIAMFVLADPSDPFCALSPVTALARTILSDEAIEMAQYAAFKNGIHPTHALIVGEATMGDGGKGTVELTSAQRKQLLTWVRQEYQGAHRYGLPLILDAVIRDLKKISNTPDEMAFMESSKLTKENIFEGVGVPPVSAGQVENVNRAASAVSDVHLLSNLVNPLAELMSQSITRDVLPLFSKNERLKAWIVPCEPHDPEMQVKKMEVASTHGAKITDNEWRQWLNMPPIKNGDEAPLNLMFERVPVELKGVSGRRRPIRVPNRKGYTALWLKQHGKFEIRMVDALLPFFSAQRDDMLSRLEGRERSFKSRIAETVVDSVFNPQQWDQKLVDAILPECKRAMMFGASSELSLLSKQPEDILFDTFTTADISPDMASGIADALNQLVEQDYWREINLQTRELVVDAIERGLLQGDTLQQLSQRIHESMSDDRNRVRALRIATTECLPGDAVVNGAEATAVYRRWYSGPMVEVITDTGRKFTGTPNHPMLTLRGWVALGDLTESDHLVGDCVSLQETSSSGNEDVEAPPSTIREVFDSLAAVVVPSRERTGKPDFHGDGMDGHVDVLRPDRVLLLGRFSPVDQLSVDGILSESDAHNLVVASHSQSFKRGVSVNEPYSLCDTSQLSTGPNDSLLDAARVNAVLPSDFRATESGLVLGADLSSRQALSGPASEPGGHQHGAGLRESSGDTSLPACVGDRIGTATHRGGDFAVTHPGKVKLDRVASLIRIESWSGHVYNLTTTIGYFNCNGFYTGNTTNGLNAGHWYAQQQLIREGLVSGRQWLTVGDMFVRGNDQDDVANHVVMEGQVARAGQAFDLQGEVALWPGHPSLSAHQRINCRCTVTALTMFGEIPVAASVRRNGRHKRLEHVR